ncbi:uncharacterized protein LOC120326221 isoform X1 [Styela clava]
MSKNSKTARAKSGGSIRPLGALRLAQGATSQHNAPTRNDPALHINQLHTLRPASPSNNNQLIKEKEREFKMLYDSYVNMQQDLRDQKRRFRKVEAKEQKLKDRISALEKLIAELRFELKTKSEICEALKKTLETKIKYYEEKLAEKDAEQIETKQKLVTAEADILAKQDRIDSLIEQYEKQIKDLKEEHERKLKELEEKSEAEIKERDGKLLILKQRMAETIGKNSSERQQQLEELKKDLIKTSQEARELHKQLKHLQLHPPKCSNCAILTEKLEDKSLQLRLKEKTITDLQNIGKSMQLQLGQQHRALVLREERSHEKHRAMCIRAGVKPGIRKATSSPGSKVASVNATYNRWRVNSAELTTRKDMILTKWEEREKRESQF